MTKDERDLLDQAYWAWEDNETFPGVRIEAMDDGGEWTPVTFRMRDEGILCFAVDDATDIVFELEELQSCNPPVRVMRDE